MNLFSNISSTGPEHTSSEWEPAATTRNTARKETSRNVRLHCRGDSWVGSCLFSKSFQPCPDYVQNLPWERGFLTLVEVRVMCGFDGGIYYIFIFTKYNWNFSCTPGSECWRQITIVKAVPATSTNTDHSYFFMLCYSHCRHLKILFTLVTTLNKILKFDVLIKKVHIASQCCFILTW